MLGICSLTLMVWCTESSSGGAVRDAELPAELRLGGDPAPEDLVQDAQTDPPWTIQGQVETAQDRERIDDSHNNLGLSRQEIEQGLRITDTHDLALLRLGFDIPFGSQTTLRLHGAGGVERTGSHVTAGTENPVFGNPAGSTETDFDFGLAPVWDAGAEFRLGFGDGPIDVTATADARGGGDTEKDSATRETYHYERYRAGLFAGCTFGVFRPYAGAHYSYYRAHFQVTDLASGSDVLLRVKYQDPLNGAAGVSISTGSVVGAVEVDFVGTITILASAGVRF